jgi:GAF domain-containing protein
MAHAPAADRIDDRFLYQIISTIGSSLDLEGVLRGVVRLLSDASAVHACFVYLLERDEQRLVLRSATKPFDHLIGQVSLARGRGVAWWTLEHREPAFIREGALEDSRFEYVPELEEERFESLVSVPVLTRQGKPLGAILLHTEAPREFTESEAEFLVTCASLLAGLIENARLYEEMGHRIRELERLTELAEAVAAAETLDDLGSLVVERSRVLLAADAVHLYFHDPAGEHLLLHSSAPRGAVAPAELGLSELAPELGRHRRRTRVAVALVAGGELLGSLVAEGSSEVDLARAVASHAAVAAKKIEVIERLAEENQIKDFFEQLSGATVLGDLNARAARLGIDFAAPYVAVAAAPASEPFERALARISPGSLHDRQGNATRAIMRVPPAGTRRLIDAVQRLQSELAPEVAIGISNPCIGPGSFAEGFAEAAQALVGTGVLRPRVLAYDDLGAYKYLLRMSREQGGRDTHREAIAELALYDETHQTSLLRTLEEFLTRRGTIGATADALYIHPNTLRQRLRRIMELTGLDLRREDWLMVEIAVKLAALQRTLGAESHTSKRRDMS